MDKNLTKGAPGARKKGIRQSASGLAAMLALGLVAACDGLPPKLPNRLEVNEETVPYKTIPLSQVWVSVPGALVASSRGLNASIEQRVGLANPTAIQGDNYMLLLARGRSGISAGRFQFEEFLNRVGELPTPFTKVTPGDLKVGEDSLGDYFWAEYRTGVNTMCVLGLRRLDTMVRQMPRNYEVIDIMLRNCVNGTVEDALKPISAEYLAGTAATASGPSNNSRMISPLAAPTPQ